MENYMKEFTDIMTDGFIYIDNEKRIKIYNKKAKELFGLSTLEGRGHSEGCIDKGDIVIIADTAMGIDDGRLEPKDLENIGIKNSSIKDGDAIVAIGRYKDDMTPVYEYSEHNERLKIEYKIDASNIRVEIDIKNKKIHIGINKENFTLNYFTSIGHMVVLDSKTHAVKFYQLKGYTARKESIKDILSGKRYSEKKVGKETEVIGKHIYEIHEKTTEFSSLIDNSEKNYNKEKFISINGHPVLCYIKPLAIEGSVKGLMLRLKDITKLTELIDERDAVLKRLNSIMHKDEEDAFHRVIGRSKGIVNIKKLLKKGSNTSATVLLLGDSGTGKSFIAQQIHENSSRSDKPFIHINCGSIPDSLMESEFFGYTEGAFTGAKQGGREGYFSLANEGTLFLDEIGEIPLSLQAKLLKVIQDRKFYPIGAQREVNIDVRIIVATNKNLENEVNEGRFRQDLYYRINVLPIIIPSLNDRIEDIEELIRARLPVICERLGVEEKKIDPKVVARMKNHDFKGNVRELENILERSIILCESDTIMIDDLLYIDSHESIQEETIYPISLKDAVRSCERKAIIDALRYTNGDRKKAMKLLDIGKTSFYDKLKLYKIKDLG